MRRLAPFILLLFVAMPLAGCTTLPREQIPTYALTDAPQTLAALAQRGRRITSLSGAGTITLTDARRNAVRLDAAFVLAPPDRARVRAWKFGQAVLDVTVRPDGIWLYLPRGSDERAGQLSRASTRTAEAVRQMLGLLSGRLDAPGATTRLDGRTLIVTRRGDDGLTLVSEIDRPTLTPRRHTLTDASGRAQFALSLGAYKTVGDAVWPTRIEATSETGTVLIETRDLDPNPDNAADDAAAFRPPARAVKVQ